MFFDGRDDFRRKGVFVFQTVLLEHQYIVEQLKLFRSHLMQVLIDLDRNHLPGLLSKNTGQRAHAGSYFQHDIITVQLGTAGDHVQQVHVDQEVLAVPFVGV